jgi:hypothetical protein
MKVEKLALKISKHQICWYGIIRMFVLIDTHVAVINICDTEKLFLENLISFPELKKSLRASEYSKMEYISCGL